MPCTILSTPRAPFVSGSVSAGGGGRGRGAGLQEGAVAKNKIENKTKNEFRRHPRHHTRKVYFSFFSKTKIAFEA